MKPSDKDFIHFCEVLNIASVLPWPSTRQTPVSLANLKIAGQTSCRSDFDTSNGDDRDRTLIAKIAAGDEAAFRQIHSRYYRRVASFTARITRRRELAEEITSDTLWIIWRSARRFKGASRVSTWIMGIAYRVSMNTLRTASRRCAHEGPTFDPNQATYEPCSESEVREWVGAGLAQLPQEQRTVLELSYQLGHSCKEIADKVNCPVSTVKTRMRYGRRKLRQLLPALAGLNKT